MPDYYVAGVPYSDELYHHGILGMHWYVRRFQNSDGTLTPAGRDRYRKGSNGKKKTHGAEVKAEIKAKKRRHKTEKGPSKVKEIASRRAHRSAMKFKAKHPWMMSDAELNSHLNRVRLEKSYKDILYPPKQKNAGIEFIKNTMGTFANVLVKGASDAVSARIKYQIDRNMLNKKNWLSDQSKIHNARVDVGLDRYKSYQKDKDNSDLPSYILARSVQESMRSGKHKYTASELESISKQITFLRNIEKSGAYSRLRRDEDYRNTFGGWRL